MKKILASVGCAAALLLVAGSGAAEPAAGAKPIKQAFNEKDCHNWTWGANKYRRCVERRGHWQRVLTPSENYKYSYKFKAKVQYWRNGQQIHSSTYDRKFFRLVKKGQPHVVKSTQKIDREYQSGNVCVSVDYDYDYQWVNGKMVRKNYSYDVSQCK